MKYEDTKSAIIAAGMEEMLRGGYDHVGIASVLNMLKVPKGSFYHYFESKEAFGCEVIEAYSKKWQSLRRLTFERSDLSPLDRLREHFRYLEAVVMEAEEVRGCLLGNLAQLMSIRSEEIRQSLFQAFCEWQEDLVFILEKARTSGQIPEDEDLHELASTIIEAYEGALILSKVRASFAPLRRFRIVTLEKWIAQ